MLTRVGGTPEPASYCELLEEMALLCSTIELLKDWNGNCKLNFEANVEANI